MSAYFDYLREMFLGVMQDLGDFLYRAFISPWTGHSPGRSIVENFTRYHDTLRVHSGEFGPVGWIIFVIFLLHLLALLGGLGFLTVVFFRKYVRFVKRELDKEELRRQGSSSMECDDMEKHAYNVNDHIKDSNIRSLNIFCTV